MLTYLLGTGRLCYCYLHQVTCRSLTTPCGLWANTARLEVGPIVGRRAATSQPIPSRKRISVLPLAVHQKSIIGIFHDWVKNTLAPIYTSHHHKGDAAEGQNIVF
ncbi:hypothetical protein AV530_012705 [Patagioenas fasciata monilis]|uniref:Uncharacterized protein n=1 Tax=Patagioenas fasciata monilis TaxID=372326 RepID=A0A1V4JCH0_PATFA|nr:hypothetical protein AV530_012705 [Patagioenas fasciata monilis]